jgi:hypothetical protein
MNWSARWKAIHKLTNLVPTVKPSVGHPNLQAEAIHHRGLI